MASLPRAQYKLPAVLRNIVDLGDNYLFGGQLAKRDMTPIGFDRANPCPTPYESSALSLKGAGGTIIRDSAKFLGIDQSMGVHLAGAQFLLGMGPAGGVFTSTSGPTAGQKFVMVTDSICQVTDANDVAFKSTLPRVAGNFYRANDQWAYVEHAQIIAENATTFFVYVRMSVAYAASTASTNTVDMAQRMRILNVDKTTWAWTMFNIWSNHSSLTQNTSQPSVATGGADAFMTNKAFRYLTTLGDGRLIFALYPILWNNFLVISQQAMRYFAFDPQTGQIAATRLYQPTTTLRYTFGAPTGLLAKSPVGLDVEGVYYLPDTIPADDTYQIRMMVLPKNLPATLSVAAYDPQVNMATCTITGMPAGLTLLAPGDVDANNSTRGQISSWLVKDGAEDFLVCYGHNNGIMTRDTEAFTPVARHQMVVFKIDATDPSKLTYVKHYSDAFGYGVILSQFTASADGKTVVVYNGSGFGIMTWNATTKGYTVSQYRGIPSGITRLHLDTSGQIWVEDVDCKVYVFNLDLSATVEVTYVGNPASLNYAGSTVEQEVDFNAYSFAGDRISRSIRIVLKGATFDDGTVQRTIVSSATAATRVKIFINGSGNVNVDAYLQ